MLLNEGQRNRNSSEIFVSRLTSRLDVFLNEIKEIQFQQFVGVLFLITASNSYFGLPMFDSQPFPILLAFIYLGVRFVSSKADIHIPNLFIVIAIFSALGIFFGAFWRFNVDFLLIRGLINYGSIIVMLIAFFDYLRMFGFPIKILIAVNLVWIFVAITQLSGVNIVSMFVAERSASGRGVTSLSPEAATFGMYLYFISWIYLMVSDYKPDKWLKIMIALNIFAIFFLAKSALTLVFILVSLIIYAIFHLKYLFSVRNIAIIIAGFILLLIIINVFLEGSRLYWLYRSLIYTDILTILEVDRSVNSRLGHQVLPLIMFFNNLGLPAGLQSFALHMGELDQSIRDFLWANTAGDKIMSWNATLIYELGLFGVMIWMILLYYLHDGTKHRFFEITLLFVILFNPIPQAYPLIPLILVIMYMTNRRYKNRKRFILLNSYSKK